jgi:hypothetical protein
MSQLINVKEKKTNHINKIKKEELSIEEYIDSIYGKGEKKIQLYKNQEKINDEDVVLPTIHNYQTLTKYNYNVQQLKQFAKCYKLKISGNKKELIRRIFIYLYLSSYLIKIQKRFRGFIQRKYNELHGPAFFKRTLCTNETDFITMEEITKIPYFNFFSYQDTDGFIYGFEISSLHNLTLKNQSNNNKPLTNPYNRNMITTITTNKIKSIIRLSNILSLPIQLAMEEEVPIMSEEKMLEMNVLSLFQKIDELGNYSDPKWFLSLNRHQTVKFIRELIDIWAYRAQLSDEVKCNILPPNGHFLMNTHLHFLQIEQNTLLLKKMILGIIEKLVTNGVDRDSKALGAYYILGALTMVNYEAATALPWLYQSVAHF